jgi:Raf kinase inhibitor-like YbhB/YbcL family protein
VKARPRADILTRTRGLLRPTAVLALVALTAPACEKRDTIVSGQMTVTSPAFAKGAHIPKRYAHPPEGENVSPPLSWSGGPAGTKEWVVIVEDPVVHGTLFVHWVLYGIPQSVTSLREGLSTDDPTVDGLTQGTNDYGHLGWGGPLPKAGDPPHEFWFWVYAIDTHLTLPPGATKQDVLDELTKGRHILANGRTVGSYRR